MAAWKLPLIVLALALPVVAAFLAGAFLVGGPALGFVAGALAVFALLVVAARQRPRRAIGVEPGGDGAVRRALVVAACPIEGPGAVAAVARELEAEPGAAAPEVRVLAPASIGFLDRWASDVEGARRRAQERLVASVAALAAGGVEAEARVGDEDVVQAVEDQLESYPADEVILVSAREDEAGGTAADELRGRLRPRFRHLQM
ncbi:MAG TPA: hypothetical protein VFY04_01825 [Solirubrobacterales bacterium]|nr:hypothetical protein [Solirubrobacterales bacterium]